MINNNLNNGGIMKKIFNYKTMYILSMIIFGTIGLFVKSINLSSAELALYRAVLAILLIGFYILISKKKIQFKNIKVELPLLIISGIAMGVNWLFLFEAYKYTSISIATLSYYFAPVIVLILCPIIFKEKLTLKKIICFLFSTVGLILIIGINDVNNNDQNLIGILFGVSAAIFYAIVIILNKFLKNMEGIQRTFMQFIFSLLILLPYVLITSGINISSLNINGFVYLLIVGFVHTGITYCMYFTSLKELEGQKAAILSYIDPLVAVLISLLILHEKITIIQIIGGFIILCFTLINEITFKKPNSIEYENEECCS